MKTTALNDMRRRFEAWGEQKKEEGAGAGEVEHVILEEDPCQG